MMSMDFGKVFTGNPSIFPFMWLFGGLEPWNFMTFHLVGNVMIPIDEVHHFSGVGFNHQPGEVFMLCKC